MRGFKGKSTQDQAWLDWLDDAQSASGHDSHSAPGQANNDRLQPRSSSTRTSVDRRVVVSSRAQPFDLAAALDRKRHEPSSDDHKHLSYSHDTIATDRHTRLKKADKGSSHEHSRSIAIDIHMPKLALPKIQYSPRALIFAVVALVGVSGVIYYSLRPVAPPPSVHVSSSGGGTISDLSFAPLMPTTSTHVSNKKYDRAKDSFSYNDVYKDAHITVSEQPLPDTFRNSGVEIKKLTDSMKANASYETIHGTLYIAGEGESGPQWMVLVHRQLLVFIQSTAPLGSPDWVTYVQMLR